LLVDAERGVQGSGGSNVIDFAQQRKQDIGGLNQSVHGGGGCAKLSATGTGE